MAKILLVEDNEMNLDMLSRRLRRRGYDVIVALDGAEGISMATSEQPDLILMDMSLPIVDGWEATQTLKTSDRTRAIPIIALTAHAMSGDKEKALETGCDDYDTKPVDLKRLVQKIEMHLVNSSQAKESLLQSELPKTMPPSQEAESAAPGLKPLPQSQRSFQFPQKIEIPTPKFPNIKLPDRLKPTPSLNAPPNHRVQNSQIQQPQTQNSQIQPPQTLTPQIQADNGVQKSHPSDEVEASSATLLVVDDIEENRNMLSRRLERKGYVVLTADNGESALKFIEQNQIDLVLLDVMMPGIGGMETLKRIRNNHSQSHLPVVMVTAKDLNIDMVQAFRLGANDYITKPINFSVALARIQTQLSILQDIRRQIAAAVSHQQLQRLPASNTHATKPIASFIEEPEGVRQQSAEDVSERQIDDYSPATEVASETHIDEENQPDAEVSSNIRLDDHYQITQVIIDEPFIRTMLARDLQAPNQPLRLLKQFHFELGDSSDLARTRQLFESEIKQIKLLEWSDQIAALLNSFTQNQDFYLVHTYVEGTSLADELNGNKPMAILDVLKLVQELLSILRLFHQRPIIHTDIQPQNIIRRQQDGRLVFTDLGIAKRLLIQLGQHSPQHFKALLSPQGYVALEQSIGRPILRSDIYSVGIIGLQALTGKKPQYLLNPMTGEFRWRNYVKMDRRIVRFFEAMVNRNTIMRYSSANEALHEVTSLLRSLY